MSGPRQPAAPDVGMFAVGFFAFRAAAGVVELLHRPIRPEGAAGSAEHRAGRHVPGHARPGSRSGQFGEH